MPFEGPPESQPVYKKIEHNGEDLTISVPPMPEGPGPEPASAAANEKALYQFPQKETSPEPEPSRAEPTKTKEEAPVPADYLENDPRYKDLLNQASLDYLKTKDQVWFQREGFTGVSEKGNLIGPGGKEAVPITLIGGGDSYREVTENAARKFKQEYSDDEAIYAEREAKRTYEDPGRDPAYKTIENEILKRVNMRAQNWDTGRTETHDDALLRRAGYRIDISKDLWAEFAKEYPQKAEAYRGRNEFIDKALKAAEEKAKQPSTTGSGSGSKPPEAAKASAASDGSEESPEDKQAREELKAIARLMEKPKTSEAKAEPPHNLPTETAANAKPEKEPVKPEEAEENEDKAAEAKIEAEVEKVMAQQERGEEEKVERTLFETFKQKLGADDVIDSAKIAYNGYIAGWYDKWIVGQEETVASKRAEIERLENDAEHIDKELKAFRADGNIKEETLQKIEDEKKKAEARLAGARSELKEELQSLDNLNISREGFILKRDEACHNYIDRTKAELRPYEEELQELSHTEKQLQSEIKKDEAFLAERRAELARLSQKLDAEQFPSIRKATREVIKRIEAEASAFEKEIRERQKHAVNVKKAIAEADENAAPLREKRAELEAVMKGEERAAPEKPALQKERARPAASESAQPASEQIDEDGSYAVDELIGSWNEMNGSKLLINPDTFKASLRQKNGGRRPLKMSIDEFQSTASMYALEHGDKERMAGMPDMKKAAHKKKSFWRLLFGLKEGKRAKKRLIENMKRRAQAKKAPNTTKAKKTS